MKKEPPLLVLRYFKLPFEPNQLFAFYTSTDNPEFYNGKVYVRFQELYWNQSHAIVIKSNWTNFMLIVSDISLPWFLRSSLSSRKMINRQMISVNALWKLTFNLFDVFGFCILFLYIIFHMYIHGYILWFYCSIFRYLSWNFENNFFT